MKIKNISKRIYTFNDTVIHPGESAIIDMDEFVEYILNNKELMVLQEMEPPKEDLPKEEPKIKRAKKEK